MYRPFAEQLYFAIQKMRGESIGKQLEHLQKTQWYSAAEIKELQWARVKRMLDHAYKNVPFYQHRFSDIGLTPQDITSFEDIRKLPILTKINVKENYADLLTLGKRYRVESGQTSGTTGIPLKYVRNRLSSGYTRAAKYRGHMWHGLSIGDKEGRMLTMTIDPLKILSERFKDHLMNRIRLSAFEMTDRRMLQFFKNCRKFRVDFLYGLPSTLYTFARFLNSKQIDAKQLNLRVIISTSEILYDFQKMRIESTFGCRVVNEYGACEVGIIAFECPEGNMHITWENIYLEVIRDGRPVAPGEIGEVAVTELNNYAMPFIRYALGDTAILSDETCDCGRQLPILRSVEGRSLDMAYLGSGRYIHGRIFDYINRGLFHKGIEISEYKVIQKQRNFLLVQVAKNETTSQDAIAYWRQQICEILGSDMVVEFQYVDSIEAEKSGKKRYFVCEVSNADMF